MSAEVREAAISEAAKWIAEEPTALDYGCAADMLDGLVADGLMAWGTPITPIVSATEGAS